MQPKWKRSRLVLLTLMVGGALFLAQPAFAQSVGLGTVNTRSDGTFVANVNIPANLTPGSYILSATGLGPLVSPYPPTTSGSLSVSSTVVVAGSSLTVSGGGFAANTPVVLALTLDTSASTFNIAQTTVTRRTLSARILVVAPGAQGNQGSGDITINNNNTVSCNAEATATADSGEFRIAQTDINIKNENSAVCEARAEATKMAAAPPQKVTKVLARTGVDALPLLASAMATILLGTVLLSAGRRRGRPITF